jgi:hypothetical protein
MSQTTFLGQKGPAVTPLLSRICKELLANLEFAAHDPSYPIENKQLPYRNTPFFIFFFLDFIRIERYELQTQRRKLPFRFLIGGRCLSRLPMKPRDAEKDLELSVL